MHKVLSGIATFVGLLVLGCTTQSIPTNQRLADDPEAINLAMNSVVALVERDEDNDLSAPTCTAFFVGPRLLATAHHCVEVPQFQELTIAPGLTIRFPILDAEDTVGSEVLFITYEEHLRFIRNYNANGEPVSHAATVIQVNEVEDVALLHLNEGEPDASNWFPMALALPETGARLYEIGMPVSQFWLLTEGMVSSIREFPNGRVTIVHQAHVAPGASGGPIFNNVGQVVGVTTSYARDAHYVGFATPIARIQELIGRPMVMVGQPTIVSTPNDSSITCQNSTCPLPDL